LLEHGLPLVHALELRWHEPEWVVAGLYLDLLARFPDTHVARKLGQSTAEEVRELAVPLAQRLLSSERPGDCEPALMDFDRELKARGINPGTSADLTVACLLLRRLAPLCERETTSFGASASAHCAHLPGMAHAAPGLHAPQT